MVWILLQNMYHICHLSLFSNIVVIQNLVVSFPYKWDKLIASMLEPIVYITTKCHILITMVIDHCATSHEQYQYDHQPDLSHYLCMYKSPICMILGKFNIWNGTRKIYIQGSANALLWISLLLKTYKLLTS